MWHPQAVLFDFDGTLADTYAGITATVNHVRAAHGLPPLTVEEVRPHVGRGPGNLLQQTVPGADLVADTARYRLHHPTVMCEGTRLLPGAADMLTILKQRRVPLALCSNKPRIYTAQMLDYLGLASVFDVVLGPEDVAQPKPAPDMLRTALQRLQVAETEALYVGDMAIDVQTARGAGVRVWVVATGSDDRAALEAARPDRILQSLAELPTLLWCRD
jgi:phosphoglycolate phosphatase